MTEILAVIVGSQLHGLADEYSDYDIRRVEVVPLRQKLSPFTRDKPKVAEGDDVTFELAHFCKMAAQGNPTVLEVLWSSMQVTLTPLGESLQAGRHHFLDMERIYHAHLGYALSDYHKLPLIEDKKKRGKKQSAILRVLMQGASLMRNYTFDPTAYRHDDLLKNLRYGTVSDDLFEKAYQSLRNGFESAYAEATPSTINYQWIEDFVTNAYIEDYLEGKW